MKNARWGTMLGALVAIVALVALMSVERARSSHARDDQHAQAASPVDPRSEGGADRRAGQERASDESRASPRADIEWFVDRSMSLTLGGRVWLAGAPANGATVVLTNGLPAREATQGAERPDVPLQRAQTDAEGRFLFQHVPRLRGSYRVEAYGVGVSPAAIWAAGDSDRRDLELVLEVCKLHIYGAVRDASGGPVAGARVFIEMLPEHVVTSNARGEFRLCTGPRPGRLRVEAHGYGPWMARITPRGALRQDVTLSPEASVAGKVILRAPARAVPFARVTLRAEGDTIAETVADDSGAFRFPSVSPGAYALEARGPAMMTKAPVSVSVVAGSESRMDVWVDPRAHVRGRLVSADGPVANTTVTLGLASTFEWGSPARSGADGVFVVPDAPLGERLFVKVEDHEVETPRTISVPDDGLDDVTIHVARRAELVVTVKRQGAIVRNASVSLRGPSPPASRWTGPDGRAVFRGLNEGRYRLVCEADDAFATREDVQITRTGNTRIDVELASGQSVEGKVVDTRGAPVDGARVDFTLTSSSEDGAAWAVTGPDGAFRGGPLRAGGSYRIGVTRSRMRLSIKGSPSVAVSPEGRVVPAQLVVVVETADNELTGRVVDEAGGPVRDARIVITVPERHGDVFATTMSGDDGTFLVRGLAAGPYAVKAVAPSGSTAEKKPVTLPSSPVVLALPLVGSIQGSLKGFRRVPSVMAWSVVGYDWDFHPAVIEGDRFTIGGLTAGRYYVAASNSEAAVTAKVEVTGSAPSTIDLVASSKRTIRGTIRDFVSGKPLSGLSCQLAPYVVGARSPVVVPGTAFSDQDGAFEFVDVPSSDLYMWCLGDRAVRGGVARALQSQGESPVTVWGLDPEGRSFDTDALGLDLDDDHPFSRRVVRAEPKSIGARAGIQPGDVVQNVGERSVDELGNGSLRNYLAFVLALAPSHSANVTVERGDRLVSLAFALD